MYLNYRGIVRVIAIFSAVMGIAMLPSALVSLVYSEFDTVLSFTGVTIPLCILAILILKLVKPSPVPFKIRDGFLIVSFCWIAASAISSLPYVISGRFRILLTLFLSQLPVFPLPDHPCFPT